MFSLTLWVMGWALTASEGVEITFPDGTRLQAEVAVTQEQRAKGLMFRDTLPADHAMLFVFDRPDRYSFWMKNTRLSLDILWLDIERRIVHIEENVPPCRADPCPAYTPGRKAWYVVETNAGFVKARGLKPGMRVTFTLPE
jgi:uncharacterized membrane protein (UPF0127 family)